MPSRPPPSSESPPTGLTIRTPAPRSSSWFLDHLACEGAAFAAAVEVGPLDAEVAGCPGWGLARLVEHLGQVHRWAAFCARTGRAPSPDDSKALKTFNRKTFDTAQAAEWYRACLAELLEVLGDLDPTASTWHPFLTAQVAALWPRRQAHETAVHRWDAQDAIGVAEPIDAELAADGVDEYVEVVVPRRLVRDGVAVPAGSLHLHCTDAEGEWLVWGEAGEYRFVRDHAKGDAVLRGPAADLLLTLWGRTSPDRLDVFGDQAVLTDWLALSGI